MGEQSSQGIRTRRELRNRRVSLRPPRGAGQVAPPSPSGACTVEPGARTRGPRYSVGAGSHPISPAVDACDVAAPTRGARHLHGVAFAVLAVVCFGAGPAALIGLSPETPVLDSLFYRTVIIASVLSIWVLLGRNLTTGLSLSLAVRSVLVGAVVFAPQAYLFYRAAATIGTGTAVAVLFLYPAVILAARAVIRRRWPARVEAAISVCLIFGIALICLSPKVLGTSVTGVVMVLVASLLYATYAVCTSRLTKGAHPLALAALVLVGTSISVGLFGAVSGSLGVPHTTTAWVAIVINGAMLGTGMVAYYAGLSRIGTTTASTIDSTQPAIAAVIGVVLMGESIGTVPALGIAIVVLCAVLGSTGIAKRRGG